MPLYRKASSLLFACTLLAACGGGKPASNTSPTGVTSMKEVPSVRLNFRYEGDVPAPQTDQQNTAEERNQAVQGDFDNGRPQDEVLDKTVSSPGKQSVLAVWHRAGDADGEFRLDMYDGSGHLQKRLTADSMSAKFPDTIRWSPDSSTVAFVACIRTIATTNPLPVTAPTPPDAAANTTTGANNAPPSGAPVTGPTPAAPTGILSFRTEQIYIANADGSGVKALTENEGLKYFYYVWSPDSSMLAALATTRREWQVQELATGGKGEEMVPYGRPRIIEKNGRERRLDDAATQVQPVWSPDSAKVAVAYGNQIRVYDALGTNPTQAAVPLRNQLLISSQAFDEQQKTLLNAANANTADPNAAANTNSNTPATTPTPAQNLSVLPDEKTLVSYNPIVALAWPQDDVIYLETAYVKRMKNAADNVTSFARWHRVILSAQPASAANK